MPMYALHPNSELNVPMKGYIKQLGGLSKQGKLDDKMQSYTKEECEKQKKVIRKRLNQQFPNKFVEGEDQNRRNPNPILIKYSITFSSCF